MGHKKAQKAQKAQNEFKGVEGSTDQPSFGAFLWLTVLFSCGLTGRDCFDLASFQQGDNPAAAIPYTIFGSPDLIGFDFSAAGQDYYGFAALPGSNSWSTG
jgi:hypothetical protein